MGVIKRQGIKHSFVTYLATIGGAINVLFIYPLVLQKEELGLIQILITTAQLITTFVVFGFGPVTVRYFAAFKDKPNAHNGFLFFVLLIPFLFYILLLGNAYLFEESINNYFKNHPNADLLLYYLPYILIFVFVFVSNTILVNYISNFGRITIPAVLENLFLKLATPILYTLYYLQYFSFPELINGIAFIYSLTVIGLFIYTYHLGQLFLKPNFNSLNKPL